MSGVTTLGIRDALKWISFVLFFVFFSRYSRCTRLMNVNFEYITILICKQMLTHFTQKLIRIRVHLKETVIWYLLAI